MPRTIKDTRCRIAFAVALLGSSFIYIIAVGDSSMLGAFHPGKYHKRIHVTTLDSAGRDYPCDDSDGPDKAAACQIHCITDPCMEPYRLCLAHAECTAIAVNKDLSFATLKVTLFSHVEPSAAACNSLADWEGWWANRTRARMARGPYTRTCAGCTVSAGILTCRDCQRVAYGTYSQSPVYESVASSVKVGLTPERTTCACMHYALPCRSASAPAPLTCTCA